MKQVKTKLSKSAPFPGKEPKAHNPVDLSMVKRTAAPYQPTRVVNKHKYDELFAGLKEGDCFEIPGGDSAALSALARAMRVYLQRQGIEGIVRQQGRTADGVGRVWLLKVLSHAQERKAA